MEVFELTIGDEVFLSSPHKLEHPIETQILEVNLLGMNTFFRGEMFFVMGEDGPVEVSRIEMSEILINSEDN